MSTTTLDIVKVDTGSDLASLVVAYHRRAHTTDDITKCTESMCVVANDCVTLDAVFYGTGD